MIRTPIEKLREAIAATVASGGVCVPLSIEEALAIVDGASVRWTDIPPDALSTSEYERIRAHPLYKLGDCIQVWANEGDIRRLGERRDAYGHAWSSVPPHEGDDEHAH